MADGEQPFWEILPLDAMSDQQWEALCDGCGRCCLQKLEDEDTGEVWFTQVACRQLDTARACCKDYPNRFSKVPDCLSVRPLTEEKIAWLPASCAYRRLAEGLQLEKWHPLISGRADSVEAAGISVAGQCLSEEHVPEEDYFQYLSYWRNVGDD